MNSKQFNVKYVCKFFGKKDHDLFQIEEDKILNISKDYLLDYKLVKNCWKFHTDRIYDENIDPDEVYENEISNSDILGNLYKGMKATFIFMAENCDSFTRSETLANKTLCKTLEHIFSYSSLPYKYMRNNYTVSLSFLETQDNKICDNFKPELEYCFIKRKILDGHNIEGVREITCKSYEQCLQAFNFFQEEKQKFKKANSVKSYNDLYNSNTNSFNSSNLNSNFQATHELITIKIYDTKSKKTLSKLNFFLFKSYLLKQEEEMYTVNTKENFSFFESIKSGNTRLSPHIRILKDTLISENNLMFISLPVSFQYLVLTHDILNYIKIRKSEQLVEEKQSKSLISKFYSGAQGNFLDDLDEMDDLESLNSEVIRGIHQLSIDESDKENVQINGTKTDNKLDRKVKQPNRKLDLIRLSKIEDTENVLYFFKSVEDN